MKIRIFHWIGIGMAVIMIILSLIFATGSARFFVIGLGFLIGAFPFVLSTIQETKVAAEKEEMFLEFARNLVESVKTGTPISKSITNIKDKHYGVLSNNIKKLSNQISLGIPLSISLHTFARDVNNKTISRAITLIGQAERAGGDIGEIFEAVTGAVTMADRLKKERKATISTLVIQGYIVFAVFILIILVMQFKILPLLSGIADIDEVGAMGTSGGEPIDEVEIANAFLYLLLIQGFFSGLTIGKLAEGHVKSGLKHSFILVVFSFLISAGANTFFGG